MWPREEIRRDSPRSAEKTRELARGGAAKGCLPDAAEANHHEPDPRDRLRLGRQHGEVVAQRLGACAVRERRRGEHVARQVDRQYASDIREQRETLQQQQQKVDLKRLVGEFGSGKKKVEVVVKDAAELAKEKEVKVSDAKERYLARKAAAAAGGCIFLTPLS